MNKFIFIPILCLFYFQNIYSQNYNWITPDQTYLKMYVAEDGIYRINKADFINAGINTSGLDPRTVKIYNKGIQVPVFFSGEQDGIFDNADYLNFYGTRNYGGPTITYNENNVPAYITDEYFNLYSDTNIYWIQWGGANGIRFSNSEYSVTDLYTPDYFNDKIHFEKDLFYAIGESYSGFDYRYLSTEKFRGEGWYWITLNDNQTFSDTVSLPLLYTSPEAASLRVFAYPVNRNPNIFNEHSIEIKVNGTVAGILYSNDFDEIDTTVNFSSSVLSNTSVNTISLKYIPAAGSSGGVFVDLFELKYPKLFKLQNNKLTAVLNSADTTSKLFRISAYNSSNQMNIFDIKNNIRVTNFTNVFDTLKFTGKSNAKFEIINDSITKKPFRIKQRQVPDLTSNSNGADYLLIYNNLFLSQAEQLRAYRQSHDNFRSFKSEIEDIYDIFNFGLENPAAVKNFVKHVYDNWQLPKLQYICLLGRGSLDPKRILTSSVYYKNLVPVYGSPPSDGYFANLNTGTFYYYDQIAIGRLPAYSESEAQTMVDKIIAYENETPELWWKKFAYITGGGVLSDQLYHQQRSNSEINTFIKPCPLSGEDIKIYRTDDSSSVTFNYADSIKNTINSGSVFVNYRGHAGSHDWEVGMHDPNVLSNGNKLPLIVSLTCFTGENAKTDFRGFGEKFIYLNNKGAIGFVGTTGWSYSGNGNDFGTYIIQTIKNDTTRRLGNLLKVAGLKMSRDSLSFSVRHTVNCYNLLGDPAVKLKLPPIPEFEIKNNDYKLSKETNEVGFPIALKIFPKDLGLCADSCKIRFQLKRYNQNYIIHDTVYSSFKYKDTVIYNFKIDTNGVYNMTVTLDQDNWYPLEDKTNNSITFGIPLNSASFIPMSPVDNSVVFSDTIEFSGLNPNFDFSQKSLKVFLELDTSSQLNSPIKRTFVNNNISGPVTKFKTSVPLLNNNTLYFWRASAVINNDTTRWPKINSFVYNNGMDNSDITDRYINENATVVLSKINPDQFSEFDFVNTNFGSNGIKLNEYSANLFVRSLGSNAEEASYFTVGDKNIFIDGGINTGLNILKVRKSNGFIVKNLNLKMNSSSSSDSLINFLNTYDSTYYLMLLNAAYVPGGTYLSSGAKSKLRQFGSIYCDSIGLMGYFHTWSLIGYLGASHSQISEMFDPCCRPAPGCVGCDHWTQSTSSMDVIFSKTSGSVTNIIGPAQIWTDFSWDQTLIPGSTLKFDVIGIDNNGTSTLLLSDVQTNKFVDLSSVKAYLYPKLNLLAKFNLDTINGTQSSIMKSIKINYTPAAELVLDVNSLQINSAQKANSITNFSFGYYNAGFSYLFGIIVNIYSGTNLLLTDTVKSILKTDSTRNYSNSFTTPVSRDSSNIKIRIMPVGEYNEFFNYNNSADFKLISIDPEISASAELEVSSDGKIISNGDYVRKYPEIKINLTKYFALQDKRLFEDTTLLSIKLNDIYIPYFKDGKQNPLLKTPENNEDNVLNENQHEIKNTSILFYPEMKSGENKLSVIFRKTENGIENDNTETVTYNILVSDEFLIKDFYNFPNPMKDETNFIFNLAGSVLPDILKIRIYTVTGRLIREIDYPVKLGYNQVQWDGKDNDGDYVSNGTYFYKLITKEETVSKDSETQIQKLVVLR